MLHDLSHRIHDGMPVYPGDQPVAVHQNKRFDLNGYNNSMLSFSPHAGTHLDGWMHMSEDPTFIADHALSSFCGSAVVFDVRGSSEIAPEDVDWTRVTPGMMVLLCTGHDRCFGSETYFAPHPVITESFADQLVAHQVRLLGVDTPSPDAFPFPCHKRLFAAGIFLVENLTRLEGLLGQEKVTFFAFPLKLQADSSPVRAVAMTPDDR